MSKIGRMEYVPMDQAKLEGLISLLRNRLLEPPAAPFTIYLEQLAGFLANSKLCYDCGQIKLTMPDGQETVFHLVNTGQHMSREIVERVMKQRGLVVFRDEKMSRGILELIKQVPHIQELLSYSYRIMTFGLEKTEYYVLNSQGVHIGSLSGKKTMSTNKTLFVGVRMRDKEQLRGK